MHRTFFAIALRLCSQITRSPLAILTMAILASWSLMPCQALAEDDFEQLLEKGCQYSRLPDASSEEQDKITQCVDKFTKQFMEKMAGGASKAVAPADPCPLDQARGLDTFSIVSKFFDALREGKPEEARTLLSPGLAEKTKAGTEAKLVESLLPDLKGGLASTTDFQLLSSSGGALCRQQDAIANITVRVASTAMTAPKLMAFEFSTSGGDARISDIYLKTRSDVTSLDGVPPLPEWQIKNTIGNLAKAIDSGDPQPLMGELSEETRFKFQPNIDAENGLSTFVGASKGKLSYQAFQQIDPSPAFSAPPATPVMLNGYPTVKAEGTAETQPQLTRFKLTYVYDIGEWRLHDFNFEFTPVKGAAVPPGQSAEPAKHVADSKAADTSKTAKAVPMTEPAVPHVIDYVDPADPTHTYRRASDAKRIVITEVQKAFRLTTEYDIGSRSKRAHVAVANDPAPRPPEKSPLQYPELIEHSLRYFNGVPTGQLAFAGETCTTYRLIVDLPSLEKDKVVRLLPAGETAQPNFGSADPWPLSETSDDVRGSRAGNGKYTACITADGLVLALGRSIDPFFMTATKVERRAPAETELKLGP